MLPQKTESAGIVCLGHFGNRTFHDRGIFLKCLRQSEENRILSPLHENYFLTQGDGLSHSADERCLSDRPGRCNPHLHQPVHHL